MKITFKNEYYINCDSCSYIDDIYAPFIQVSLKTNDLTSLINVLKESDMSEITIDSAVGSLTYYGFANFEPSVSVMPDMSFDVSLIIKKPTLEDRMEAIEELNKVNIDAMTLDEYKDHRQQENNAALAAFLYKSSVEYNGKNYGVSYEDQTEMTMNLVSFNLYSELGILEGNTLEWHAKKEECTAFTKEQFIELIIIVKAFVYPYIQTCQSIKAAIYACETKEQVSAIQIQYESIGER